MEIDDNDDDEEDMVAVEAPNMWSKGKGVQDASRDPSQDHRGPVEIIDDQDLGNNAVDTTPVEIDSKHTSKRNSQTDKDNNAKDVNTKDKPSGKKKAKKSSQIKEEIFKALE